MTELLVYLIIGSTIVVTFVLWVIYKSNKKEKELNRANPIFVQDGNGSVITQEAHRRIYGFNGYPPTHSDTCVCFRCTTTRDGYYHIYTQTTHTIQELDKDFTPKKSMRYHDFNQSFNAEEFQREQRDYINRVRDELGIDIIQETMDEILNRDEE